MINIPDYPVGEQSEMEACNKRLLLKQYLGKITTLPPPSAQKIRPYIGGSEMHAALHSKGGFINQKFNMFDGNFHTKFGNTFEHVSKSFIGAYFNETVEESNSIPGMRNDAGDLIQVYTPDGLVVIGKKPLVDFLELFGQEIEVETNDGDVVVLLEFKSPSKRKLVEKWDSKTIGYKTQVLTGLDTIEMVDVGLYVDCVFRACLFEDLRTDNFEFAPFVGQDDVFDSMVCYGMLGFYSSFPYQVVEMSIPYTSHAETRKELVKGYLDRIDVIGDKDAEHQAFIRKMSLLLGDKYKYMLGEILDLSQLDECVLEEMMERTLLHKTMPGKLDVHVSTFNKDPITYINDFKSLCLKNKWEPVAVLPWKMFKMNCWPVYREPNFLEQHRELLTSLHRQLIERING